jgi:hypothetical protein
MNKDIEGREQIGNTYGISHFASAFAMLAMAVNALDKTRKAL